MFNLKKAETPYLQQFLDNPDYMKEKKGLIASIVQLAPDEYMRECAKIHGNTLEKEYNMIDKDNLARLRKYVTEGKLLPIPFLDYVVGKQEGRHRALLAKEMGYETIPVMIIKCE